MKMLFSISPTVVEGQAESTFTEAEEKKEADIVTIFQIGRVRDEDGKTRKTTGKKRPDGKAEKVINKGVYERDEFFGNDEKVKVQKAPSVSFEYPSFIGVTRRSLCKDQGTGEQLVLCESDDPRYLYHLAEDARVTPLSFEDAQAIFSKHVAGGRLESIVMPFDLAEPVADGEEN